MTVKELRQILKTFDKDSDVLVDGYEYGVCDLNPAGVQAVRYSRDLNTDDYAGEHEIEENGRFFGVLLSRGY